MAAKVDHLFNSRGICFSVSNLKLGKLLELACTLSEYWHNFKQMQDVPICLKLSCEVEKGTTILHKILNKTRLNSKRNDPN